MTVCLSLKTFYHKNLNRAKIYVRVYNKGSIKSNLLFIAK